MSLNTDRIRGKVCVVTGSVRSIGFDIASRYAEYGAKTVLIDYDRAVTESAASLRGKGYDATGIALDVTDHAAVLACFDRIEKEIGPVFSLVNCAGVGEVGPFEKMEPAMWERVIRVNLFGTVNCLQGALRYMRGRGEGKVMNFASKAGKTGSKLMTVYGASKGAVITLTQALAQEYAQYHLNINCVCPDIIKDTGIWDNVVSVNYSRDYGMSKEDVTTLYENKVPLGRFVLKEDITDIVCFYTISGDDCTGQSINITGGRFMH